MMRKILMSTATLFLMTAPLMADNCGVLCQIDWWENAEKVEIDAAIAAVSPNALDANGLTPLDYAITLGTPEAILAMVKAGADPNAQHNDGSFPLGIAVAANSVENFAALIQAGADVNVSSNKTGATLLHRLATRRNTEMAALLLIAGANPNVQKKPANETPLHLAISNKNLKYINMLLNAGADPNLQDIFGYTPLHLALLSLGPKHVQALLDAGADPNLQAKHNLTPLHAAVQHSAFTSRNSKILNPSVNISILLEAGADASVTNGGGETAFDLAQKNEKLRGTDAYEQLKAATNK